LYCLDPVGPHSFVGPNAGNIGGGSPFGGNGTGYNLECFSSVDEVVVEEEE
tara:strand:+ start:112 stop:264 length:153 start_codon:yes stop_codon:yes gene_type:complete